MTIYKKPELEPGKEPLPIKPILDPKPAVAPDAWEISASKTVDGISKHESNHESRHDIKQDPKQGITPKSEDGAKPGAPQPQGGKPMPGAVKR